GLLPDAFCKYIARSTSDHAPLSFVLKVSATRYGPSSFKFQQMWMSHPNFRDVVKDTWNEQIGTMGLFGLATKLKKLKVVLKDWKRRVFGRIEKNIQSLENQIEQLESQLHNGFSEDTEMALLVAKEELAIWIQREETRLSQHVKLSWLEKGEASAQFFKTFALANPIVHEMRLRDGSCLATPPNPDGFGSDFYKSCWDIVEADVVAAIQEFFLGTLMPRFYSASYIVLIPKMQKPTSFDKFRSISLYSVLYKGNLLFKLLEILLLYMKIGLVKYLGVPLMVGRIKVSHFDDLLNCIRRKLEGCYGSCKSDHEQFVLGYLERKTKAQVGCLA
ncbi:hypothetical protein F2P56_034046, partial [Juglans regia]